MDKPAAAFHLLGSRGAALLGGVLVAVSVCALPAARAGDLPGMPGAKPDDAPTNGSTLATVTLVSERDALQPGSESWIGLHFTISKGWHLYWRNNGDTGAPMRIALSAPPGVELGDIVYPAPTRHPEPGGFVDFVYEDEVTLLVPVSVSQSLPAGQRVTIDATVDWLVCSDMCLAGQGRSSLVLPIAGSAHATSDAPLFEAARLRVPRPMVEAQSAGIRAAWHPGRRLVIGAPGSSGLTFFPYESKADAYPEDMAEHGTVEANSISLQYDDHADDAARIKGVLEVRTPEKTSWYEIVVESPDEGSH